jgi:SepF-like predicted cell division protein (DUF552 family)
MENDEVGKKLDTIISVLRIAHRTEIEAARASIREDKVNAAILDGAKKLTPAGKLRTAVMKKTGTGASTFNARIVELLELGVLEKEGGGPTTQYRATGLI